MANTLSTTKFYHEMTRHLGLMVTRRQSGNSAIQERNWTVALPEFIIVLRTCEQDVLIRSLTHHLNDIDISRDKSH